MGELRDLFAEHAEKLYGSEGGNGVVKADDQGGDDAEQAVSTAAATTTSTTEGIENEIEAEIAGLHRPAPGTRQLFVPIKLGVQCGS